MRKRIVDTLNHFGFLKGFSFRDFTWSQTGEDAILQFAFDLLKIKNPGYLDIGANHPFKLNNTAKFYLQGGKGINIEPNPFFYKLLQKYRPRDLNLNTGITPGGGVSEFYVLTDPNLSSFSKSEVDEIVKQGPHKIEKIMQIDSIPVEELISRYAGNEFPDLLSIDAEGLDLEILMSIDYDKHFPKIICAETINYSPTGDGVKRMDLIDFLTGKDYFVFADTFINSIFIRRSTFNERSR